VERRTHRRTEEAEEVEEEGRKSRCFARQKAGGLKHDSRYKSGAGAAVSLTRPKSISIKEYFGR
jgi:hypothetical protein